MNKKRILITTAIIALALSVCLNISLSHSWNLAEKKILDQERMNNVTLKKLSQTNLFLEGCFKEKRGLREGLIYCKHVREDIQTDYLNSSGEREECKKQYVECGRELKGLAAEKDRYQDENTRFLDRITNLTDENERLKAEITQLKRISNNSLSGNLSASG